MPYTPPPDLAGLSLAEVAIEVGKRNLPPLSDWDPPEHDHSRMRIASDGVWFHDNGPIRRPAMVRAFAGLLRREADGRYFLVTPHYKQEVDVEDAAFIAVDCKQDGDALAFRLNTDELVIAGPGNPLRAAGDPDAPAIYLLTRNGCEARLDRSTWLQLAEIALSQAEDLTVSSLGATFSLVPA